MQAFFRVLLLILFPYVLVADSLAFRGELLYWSPSYDETYFVLKGSNGEEEDTPTPFGRRINNPVGFDLGFRVSGVYYNPCVDVRLRWTHLYATSRKVVDDFNLLPHLWPIAIIPGHPDFPEPFSGIASSQIGLMHQRGECLFDERVGNLSCFHFYLREGLEWSYIRYHESIEYQEQGGIKEIIEFHAHTKGMGPQLGIIALCEPWHYFTWYPRNLVFKFMTSASLIIANSKAKIATTDILGVKNQVTQSSFWKLVPEWSLTLGINYITSFCKQVVSLELGYEMTTYFQGISKLLFVDNAHPGVSFNQYSDFYVQGLTASLAIFF